MSIRHPMFRILAIYIVVALIGFAPVASIHEAAQAIGLKKLLVGGLVGAAGLVALGALAGPAGAIGAAGCAGTGFMGTLGGALGTLVSGVTGISAAMGTLSTSSMATLGLMVGGAAVGIMGLLGSAFMAVPALVCGAGLLAYFWTRSSYRYGQPYDRRYSGPMHDPFFNAGSRIANNSQSGYRESGSGSVIDRMRSLFDRDRRDDRFGFSNRYVDQNGYIRQGSDFFASLNRFINGRSAGYSGGVPQSFQNRYPYAAEETPSQPAKAAQAVSSKEDHLDTKDLEEAKEARKIAYQRLIKAMQDHGQSEPATSGAAVSGIQSKEVQGAIRDYKEADGLVKEITGRLQHREKQ